MDYFNSAVSAYHASLLQMPDIKEESNWSKLLSGKISFAEFLGMTPEQFAYIGQLLSEVTSMISKEFEQELAAQQEVIDYLDKRIERQKELYDIERENAQKGYANSVPIS